MIVEFNLRGSSEYIYLMKQDKGLIPKNVDYYMFLSDVPKIEKGLQKVGRLTLNEKLLDFAIKSGMVKRVDG